MSIKMFLQNYQPGLVENGHFQSGQAQPLHIKSWNPLNIKNSVVSTNLLLNLFVVKDSRGNRTLGFLIKTFYESIFKSVVFVNSAVKTPVWAYNP